VIEPTEGDERMIDALLLTHLPQLGGSGRDSESAADEIPTRAQTAPSVSSQGGSGVSSPLSPARPPLRDTRADAAFEQGAIKGFDTGYQIGLQEGARMALEQAKEIIEGSTQ